MRMHRAENLRDGRISVNGGYALETYLSKILLAKKVLKKNTQELIDLSEERPKVVAHSIARVCYSKRSLKFFSILEPCHITIRQNNVISKAM